MIYLTGDIHGNPFERFSYAKNPEMRGIGENDIMIVLGDFGIPFGINAPYFNLKENLYSANWLNEKPWTTIAIAGNHDDRDAIGAMPEIQKFGGTVRQLAFAGEVFENIFYIDKPGVYTIEDKTFLVIPGAESHDIQDGILNPNNEYFSHTYKRWIREQRMFRTLGWDWWANEEIEYEKVQELIKDGLSVDYVLSHEAPVFLVNRLVSHPEDIDLFFKDNKGVFFLEKVSEKVEFQKWFCGHHHVNVEHPFGAILFKKIVKIK